MVRPPGFCKAVEGTKLNSLDNFLSLHAGLRRKLRKFVLLLVVHLVDHLLLMLILRDHRTAP